MAGAPIEGGIYSCALKPVEQAVADGTYARWMPNAREIAMLKQIFPEGVCDYTQAGPGSTRSPGARRAATRSNHTVVSAARQVRTRDLVGNADVATTMIYTHVLKVGGGAVCSPMDSKNQG